MDEKKLFTDKELQDIKKIKNTEDIHKTIKFKPYETGDNYIFPPTTDEYIPKNHVARLVNLLIDRMDISFIIETYKGGGASSYHPGMMLKVWILGFIYRIYTSRKLEKALEENLPFIWISGSQIPDFRTLNNFRKRLKGEIKNIFKQIVQLGISLGIIEGKDVFIDHTKFEANANRHKIVWRKQVKNQLAKIDKELDELFNYIDELNDEEDKKYGNDGIKENEVKSFDVEKIDKMINSLNDEIKKKRKNKENTEKLKEKKKKLRRTKELLNRKDQYNLKEKILGNRNSYSRTDTDATAMMQKDYVSIKPSYNEGIAVENGFILNYEQSDKCADNVSFKSIVDGTLENINKNIENIHTDGAYGNEENSEYLEEKGINNYLKFNTYRKEKSKKWHREKVRKEDFRYIKEYDYYVCPDGTKLYFVEEKIKITATGYKVKIRIYKTEQGKCGNCLYKNYCTKSEQRTIQISEKYERYKDVMRSNLDSPKGKELRKQRGFEVESVFGDRKYNNKFHRFVLRGIKKINIESGLYYTAHNIKKIYNFMIKNWYKSVYINNLLQSV